MAEKHSYSLLELAKYTDSKIVGDPNSRIEGIEDLEQAGPLDAAFFENPRYEKQLRQSNAGVIFASPPLSPSLEGNFLLNENPSLAFQKVIELFIKPAKSGFSQIHPSAVIHKDACIGEHVSIGPHVVIDREAKIDDHTAIGAGCMIGAETTIGSNCCLHANVVVRERCSIGNNVQIQPGAVIGSCGFGYFTNKDGKHLSLNQLGNVIIEDDVEIGANTTIDRARFKATRIKRGTKIDNLVQIAHQVSLGEDNLVVSQVGIAGSTKTGRNVVMGGQVGIIGHITITDGVILTARTAVTKSLEKSGIYCGTPAMKQQEFREHFFHLRKLGKLIKEFKTLKEKIDEFEKQTRTRRGFGSWIKKMLRI